jgi:hypothetical protein
MPCGRRKALSGTPPVVRCSFVGAAAGAVAAFGVPLVIGGHAGLGLHLVAGAPNVIRYAAKT